MNCDRCPHMKRILAALKPCQTCEAGKLHGECHFEPTAADYVYSHRVQSDHTPSDGCTRLNPDDEDRLRKAMSSLFALDPLELLMVQHVMRGQSYASFAAPLGQVLRRLRVKELEIEGGKPGFRAWAHTIARKVEEKMPMMRDVMKARINPNAPIA